jgi:hypothetical protein
MIIKISELKLFVVMYIADTYGRIVIQMVGQCFSLGGEL